MYQLLPLDRCGGVGLPPSDASTAPRPAAALVPSSAAGQFDDAEAEDELEREGRVREGGSRPRTTPMGSTLPPSRRGTNSGASGGSNSVTPDLLAPEVTPADAARNTAGPPSSPQNNLHLHPSHPSAFATQPRLIGFVPSLPAGPVLQTPTTPGIVSGLRVYTPIAPRGGLDRLLRVPIPSYAGRYFVPAAAPAAATTAAVAAAATSPPHAPAFRSTVGSPVDASASGSAWASPATTHLHTPPHAHPGVGGSPPSAASVVDAARTMAALRDRVAPSCGLLPPDPPAQPNPHRPAVVRREDWDRLSHPSPIVCPFVPTPMPPPATVPTTFPTILPDVSRESDVSERRNPITNVVPRDILLGRGGQANHHAGNVWFRTVVGQYRIPYCVVAKGDKMQLARHLATYLYLCGARFLVKDGGASNVYYEAGHDIAAKKCSQALREGAAAVVRRTLQGSLAAVNGGRGAATGTAVENDTGEAEEVESEEEEDDDEASTASASSKSPSSASSSSSSSILMERTAAASSPSTPLGEPGIDHVVRANGEGRTHNDPDGQSGSGARRGKRRRASPPPAAVTGVQGESRTRVKWEHWRKRPKPRTTTAWSERNG